MRLVRLRIDALPGIEPGFTFEVRSARVNVVTGPNAVGKSSLVRALGYLLRGAQRDDPQALAVSAEFSSGDTRWTVRRSGAQVLWTRDGETVTPPALPGADQISLNRLGVEQLVADDRSDAELAAWLRRSLRGGFDIDEPRSEMGSRFARAEEKALRASRRKLGDVDGEYVELRRLEGELPGLERRISAAEAAVKNSRRLQTAVSLLQAVDQRRACEQQLADFPPALAQLQGDEVGRVDSRASKVADLEKRLQSERGRLESAIEDHRRTGFSDSRPTAEEVAVMDRCLQRLSVDQAQRVTARDALAKADSAVERAVSEFDGPGRMPKLDRDSLKRTENIAEPLIAARASLRELEQRIEMGGEPPEESEIDRLRRAANALRGWLADTARSGDGGTAASRWHRLALWAALAGAALAAVLSYLQNAIGAAAGAVAAMLASGGALILHYRRPRAVRPAGEEARRQFEETGLARPRSWNAEAVRECLYTDVESRLNELLLQRERTANVKQLRIQLGEAAKKVNTLEAERSALAEEVGFDPCLPLTALDRFVRRCLQLDDARRQREACGTELELIDRRAASAAARIGSFLDRWQPVGSTPLTGNGTIPEDDLLQVSFDGFRERLTKAESATNQIRISEGAVRSLRKQIDDANNELGELFDRAGLETGDRAALAGLLEQLKAWQAARSALDQARGYEKQLYRQLEDRPELVQLVDQRQNGELQSRLEAAERQANEHTSLVARRAEIETRLETAGSESKLEQALAGVSQAREALADKLDQALLHCATELLLDDVEEAFQSQHEPAVLRRARSLFAEVTAYEFTLELDDDGFMARDSRHGDLKSLRELSSGTRMQLLLALRLAWTESREQGGETLPLFLDEALTTSDESRFKVMATGLERLAEAEGRQIFYLTARAHEAALWHDLTGARPPVIDLAKVRFGDRALAARDYRVEQPPSHPAPGGSSAEDYAVRLGVPPLDPHLPSGTVHLFHLLRDELGLLHRLMDGWRLGSVGQLEKLLASSAAPGAISDAAVRTGLERRCHLLRAWSDLWRRGRGRPVDRGVLERSGAVSPAFIEDASNLADELEGDGRALIEALRSRRLQRFHTSKIDELESWLLNEGITDERPTLSAEDRRRFVLQQLAPATDAAASDMNEVVTWLETGAR